MLPPAKSLVMHLNLTIHNRVQECAVLTLFACTFLGFSATLALTFLC